jgi:UDP-N-acetylmuramoyl-tripeptide--D-alanyl-D-alanine ligase
MLILSAIWFVRTIKGTLFYLYLWQLKEYHIGRFINHFQTAKGRSIFLNKVFAAKVLIIIASAFLFLNTGYPGKTPFLTVFVVLIFLYYSIEVFVFLKNLLNRSIARPTFTKKAIFLTLLAMSFQIAFFILSAVKSENIFNFVFWLLLIDVLGLFIISTAVLAVQPFVVLYRNQFVLKKAKEKIAGRKDLIIIGITGSYGKTSTKEFLAAILSKKFKVLKTDKHQNSEIGISQCILDNLASEHQVFVVEMGAYGVGGIKLLCDIVRPKIGILTGINEQHLSLFGSQANIIQTKYELIKSLPKDGLAIFNGDNKYCQELFRTTGAKKKIYKTSKETSEMSLQPDIWADNILIKKDTVSFTAITKNNERAEISANVLGGQNILNMLAAILAARELGMSLGDISIACSMIAQTSGAMTLKTGLKGLNILDSSYSANPDGVLADLEYLKVWQGKKIIIMPCLIELGEPSKKIHTEIGRKIGRTCDLAIITSKERFEDLKKGAMESGMQEKNILLIERPENVITQIEIFSQIDDVILLEGRVFKEVINTLLSKEND